MDRFRRILNHPFANIFTAAILIVTSLAQGWGDFTRSITDQDAGVHHGVLVFGIVMLLRGIAEALEAVRRVDARQKELDSAG